MATGQDLASRGSCEEETRITDAAIEAFARLLRLTRGKFITHGPGDGGLICEDRTNRSRPTIWRILPGGGILPDTRYSFALGMFITVVIPGEHPAAQTAAAA